MDSIVLKKIQEVKQLTSEGVLCGPLPRPLLARLPLASLALALGLADALALGHVRHRRHHRHVGRAGRAALPCSSGGISGNTRKYLSQYLKIFEAVLLL